MQQKPIIVCMKIIFFCLETLTILLFCTSVIDDSVLVSDEGVISINNYYNPMSSLVMTATIQYNECKFTILYRAVKPATQTSIIPPLHNPSYPIFRPHP